jgi:riboflavin synthase
LQARSSKPTTGTASVFTGIVTDIGEVLAVEARADGLRRLSIASRYAADSIQIGASISCSGICLTVVKVSQRDGGSVFHVDTGAETLAVTTAKDWKAGTKLNLERALRMGDELGGHLVSGHIDGIAQITARENLPEMARFELKAPAALSRFIAQKGSVALDGISLTVNAVRGEQFSVLIIPHTLAVTTLGSMREGAQLNLEVDMMARYAARLMGS